MQIKSMYVKNILETKTFDIVYMRDKGVFLPFFIFIYFLLTETNFKNQN